MMKYTEQPGQGNSAKGPDTPSNRTPFLIHDPDGDRLVHLPGRVAWAMEQLLRAGKNGCTPIDTPGPRWSDYVFKMRKRFGIDVETETESHGGPFPGSHARYRLRSRVSRVRAV